MFYNFVHVTFVFELHKILMFNDNDKITMLRNFCIYFKLRFYRLELKEIPI